MGAVQRRCRSRRDSAGRNRASTPRPVESLEPRVLFAAFTWDGGGADANWSTADNWADDVAPTGGTAADTLAFPGSAARKTNVNDLASGAAFAAITFSGSGGYSITGNPITLGTAGVSDGSSGANTLGTPLAIAGATTVSDTDDAAALTLSGIISGGGSVERAGDGVVVFTGANTYTGGTTLDGGGDTYANNPTGTSAFGAGVVINTSGALRGDGGFAGTFMHNAGLSPGPAAGEPGTLATGSVDFGAGSGYTVNLNGGAPGTGYDRLAVTGTVDLGTGRPLYTSGTFSPSGGEKLFILVNDGVDPIVGTFSGFLQGATFDVGGSDYQISYTGDLATDSTTGGNDVVLRAVSPNAAPVNAVPGAQTTAEDTPLVFAAANGNAITASDADGGGADLRVTVSVTGGTLTLPDPALVTGGANGSDTVTLTGAPAAVNAALDGLSFAPAADSTAAVTLTVLTNDLGNGGAGGPLTDSDTVTVAVSAVNDAPVNAVPGTQTVPQNGTVIFGLSNGNRITVADLDAGGDDLAVTLTATNATVTVGSTTGVTLSGAPDATDEPTLTITGPASAINAALNDMTFRPTTGFFGIATLRVETSDLGHSGAGGAKADDDTINVAVAPPGGLDFDPASYTVVEAGGTVTLTVNRTNGASGPATVDYAVTGGTATAGADFTAASGTLAFADGETSKTFTLAVADDALDEDDETVAVSLSSPTGSGVLGVSATTAVVTLTDDDPSPALSIASASATEGGVASFAVTLSAVSGRPVTVSFMTADGTATAGSDYTASAGTVTFAPGETGKTIAVATLADVLAEDAETFSLTLHNPVGATIAGAGVVTGNVNNLPNALPVAADDAVALTAGQADARIVVLANDADADADALAVSAVGSPAHGTAVRDEADNTITYTPAAGYSGADAFTYTVSDGKGGAATATVNLTVTGNALLPNPANPKRQDLFFAASPGDDQVQLVRVGRQVRVLVGGQDQGTFAATGNVVISGGAGNDALLVGKLKLPVLFNGGAGDDTLAGGSKKDVLVGGAGDDTLNAGGGRNLIVGGDGADTITGGGGADILIAGPTAYDADTADNRRALADLLATWTGRGSYASKLASLGAGVGASAARLAPGATALDDAFADTLNGAGAADLFVANTSDAGTPDALVKKARNESVVEL